MCVCVCEGVCVGNLPLCVLLQSYDHGDSQGVWLVCFNSEYELGKFERALSSTWTELFQVRHTHCVAKGMLEAQKQC